MKHRTYDSTAFDLGIFDQALSSTINDGYFFETTALGVTLEGRGYSTFSVHLNLILFLILPLYYLYQNPETLLIIQSLFIGLGVIPLYLLARKEINRLWATALSIIYLMYPSLHWINLYDFHPESMVPCFILFSFLFLKKKRYNVYFIFLILSLACKEDVMLVVIGLGLYIIISERIRVRSSLDIVKSEAFRVGIITVLIGVFWIFLTHAFTTGLPWVGKWIFIERYSHMGRTWADIAVFMLDPINIFTEISSVDKLGYITKLLLPLSFVPLFSPSILAIPIIRLMENIFSNAPAMYDFRFHYTAPIIPFLFISAVYSAKKIFYRMKKFSKIFMIGMIIVSGISSISLGPISSSDLFPEKTNRQIVIDEAITLIPKEASVSTHDEIFPHLSSRSNTYLGYQHGVQYIIVDTNSRWYHVGWIGRDPISRFDDKIEYLVDKNVYNIIFNKNGILLLEITENIIK
jgi:uncharacterized membrane protein